MLDSPKVCLKISCIAEFHAKAATRPNAAVIKAANFSITSFFLWSSSSWSFASFTSLSKFDILTGRRRMVRKFGILGDSTVMRFPPNLIKHYGIKPGDFGIFEEVPGGILIKPLHAKELER